MKSLLFSLLLLVSAASQAGDLSPQEKRLEYIFDATLVADMMQTLDIKNHPKVHERNVFLGDKPSDKRIVTYFLASGIAHWYITEAIEDRGNRQVWQYASIIFQLAVIAGNKKAGLNFSF